jgi:RimJ/RimL family protein N-acetyltransferase
VEIEFVPLATGDEPVLDALLREEPWPYHSGGGRGVRWHGEGIRTFWITVDGSRAGVVRLYDLDGGPMFDLRLRAAYRGRGIGTAAVGWLTEWVFAERPGEHRVEGTTRADNAAMRRVFERCGYTHEATYRQGWPVPGGEPMDAIGYAILRTDPRPVQADGTRSGG